MIWLIVNRNTRSIRSFKSREEATEAALELNARQLDHPRFDLWSIDIDARERQVWHGFLSEFDKTNPWKKAAGQPA